MTTVAKNVMVLSNLLSGMVAITKKYQEIARVTGENFNVFRVLKMDSDEVRMHSAFLGELLNPNGSHGQGDVFLRLFVNQFNIAAPDELKVTDFKFAGAVVKVEEPIGEKTETTGGRIDLLVSDKDGRRIIIENKIYAGDQDNQLMRYRNFDRNASLCYLTLNGKEPSIGSITEGREDVVRLSYKTDIVAWLELCLKETAKFPILRETISQYINLIKQLTYQSTNHIMEKEEMQIILKDEDSLTMALKLAAGGDSIKKEVMQKFLDSVEQASTPGGFKLVDYTKDKPMGWPETIMKFSKSSDAKIFIAIEFTNYNHLDIGICSNKGETIENREDVFKKMEQYRTGGKQSEGWPWYIKLEEWNQSNWWSVYNGSFKEKLFRIIDEIGGNLPELFAK